MFYLSGDCERGSYTIFFRQKPAKRLTRREKEIASLAVLGLSNGEISFRLEIKPATVRNYLNVLYRKLAIESRVDLVRYMLLNYPAGFLANHPPIREESRIDAGNV